MPSIARNREFLTEPYTVRILPYTGRIQAVYRIRTVYGSVRYTAQSDNFSAASEIYARSTAQAVRIFMSAMLMTHPKRAREKGVIDKLASVWLMTQDILRYVLTT